MKNQFKTLEQFLIESIYEKTDFCLSFSEIPNAEFVQRFRQQYANEFSKLEVLDEIDEEDQENYDINNNPYGLNRNLGRVKDPSTPSSSYSKEESKLNSFISALKADEEEQKAPVKYEFKKI